MKKIIASRNDVNFWGALVAGLVIRDSSLAWVFMGFAVLFFVLSFFEKY